ncbi:MAG TPA: ABC-F family ATP-binding cassette domain-containing protein [Polyangiaceae bacterium]|nr:ABC-F family ATP-binding cassette domain-containing protein [Polyangiaceae bacterium]
MIRIAGLAKQFGPQVLFSEVELELLAGQRYGLVGANGSGKSTFLRILTGEESSDAGEVRFGKQLRLGVLRQDQFAEDEARILDVAMRGDAAVFEALGELDRLAHAGDAAPADTASRIAELTDFVAHNEGYLLETRAREILVGLGIPSQQVTQPLRTLSGGFKLRVLLAQVLVGRPEALLLDEPTNHLDILSIRWLERFLQSFAGCAVVISHDRRFLDAICTRMLDVDYGTITDYAGNYARFVERKALARVQLEAEVARAEKVIAEKRAFVERFGAKATKAKQAQSRLRQIEKIEVKEVVGSSRRAPGFRFEQERQSGKDVLGVEGISKSYGEKRVLSDVGFTVRRGEKVAIIGENGIGKSTLLKILAAGLAADSGRFTWGVNVKLGYFAQDHHDLLFDPNKTPLDFIWDAIPAEPTATVRGHLGRMLFSGAEVEKKVTSLSGGEAARLVFTRILVQKPNVLILDEPTNHLDLETIETLADALAAYEGTLLFVSHDRWFVSRIADRIVELRRDGLHDFRGAYDEYLASEGADHLDIDVVSLKAKQEKKAPASGAAPAPQAGAAAGSAGPTVSATAAAKPAAASTLSYEERKRRANRLKTLPKRRDELLAKIEVLEAEQARIEAEYSLPGFFERTPAEEVAKRQARERAIGHEHADAMRDWEEVELEIEELSRDGQ